MTLSIIYEKPQDFKLFVDFGGLSECKLYKKDDEWICSIVHHSKEILYIKIVVSSEQMEKRTRPPLGFTKDEFFIFTTYLIGLSDSINQGLKCDEKESILYRLEPEYIAMPFWANRAVIYIAENRKTITLDEFNILYALSQTIYAVFGEVQRRANFHPF